MSDDFFHYYNEMVTSQVIGFLFRYCVKRKSGRPYSEIELHVSFNAKDMKL